jgi:Domain of unknown function (DUF4055)
MPVTNKNTLDAIRAPSTYNSYHHPDYNYYRSEWNMIRDAIAGERRIKEKGTDYLPSLDTDFGTAYEKFKSRAVYVNMVSRTVSGLVGTLFKKNPKVSGVKLSELDDLTIEGLPLNLFAKKVTAEVAGLGRIGLLVDMIDEKPYLTEYVAENILSWKYRIIKGRQVITYVLLREIVNFTPEFGVDNIADPNSTAKLGNYTGSALIARHRVLTLENGIYKQKLYSINENMSPNTTLSGQKESMEEIIPTRGGEPLDFIPFVVIGPLSPTAEIQRSPIADITYLNIAHYKTSAMLEHGRHYTALPVYYAPIAPGQEDTEYLIGPDVVWEVPEGTTPGILEYKGQGLKSLSDSLVEKEEHIAQLGGRIMGIRPLAVAESDNIYAMKQAAEIALLLGISESVSQGLTVAVRWYLDWQRKPIKGVVIKLNQDFKEQALDARELRAVALLYQSGIYPIEELFRVLQNSDFVHETTTLEDFKEMLNRLASFPNQPDVAAQFEGYADASARTVDQRADKDRLAANKNSSAQRKSNEKQTSERGDQQLELQTLMFDQGRHTATFEADLAAKAAKNTVTLPNGQPKPAEIPTKPVNRNKK